MRTESAFTSLLPEPAGWSGQLPESPPTLGQARRYCQDLAQNHYENFHVVSWLFPRALRAHLHAVYAYCRWADDLGDESGDPERSLWLLKRWEEELLACYQGRARHPVFVALRDTVQRFEIPPEPFLDLLTAFRQDQVKKRYQDFGELLDYCRYSANPVGRLVLYVCGCRDRERQQLSDFTCTALQLASFWQDVWRDYQIGRIYLPLQDMMRHAYSEQELASRQYNERFARLLQELVERTGELFRRGLPLASQVERWLAVDIELFSRGGMEVLRLIERQNYDVLGRRPSLTREEKTLLFASTALSRMFMLRKSPPRK
ncbi:MAG: squalene synthase HpnC [Acidobacteria bacterium RIFCSPLOWO2_02_FULL_59_13]|nr:MAG: squalene synthase HpnC [Acidobacteria bacterium RIFCSPLOWO2_02_FULL_59_13]